jgi:putative tryptophan/tyrosine transport system substrate-binding protein
MQQAARTKGMQLNILKAGTESEIETAFESFVKLHVGSLVIGADPFFYSRRDQFVALAARHAVPAIYPMREFAVAGGLISFGPSLTAAYGQLGSYDGKILKCAKPADLPVEQPTRFELVVNLNTAKALARNSGAFLLRTEPFDVAIRPPFAPSPAVARCRPWCRS